MTEPVQSGRLRVSDACVLIGLRRRQVFRLLRGLRHDGATRLDRLARSTRDLLNTLARITGRKARFPVAR